MKTLGNKLKALRLSKGWSQEDIAYELDLSLGAYSNIERDITDISLSRLKQIAKLFKLTVPELLTFGNKSASLEKEYEQCKKLLEQKNKEIKQKDAEIIRLQKKLLAAFEKGKKNK